MLLYKKLLLMTFGTTLVFTSRHGVTTRKARIFGRAARTEISRCQNSEVTEITTSTFKKFSQNIDYARRL